MSSSGQLKKKQIAEFKSILVAQRERIIENARRTLKHEIELPSEELPDEMDLASSVYEQNLSLRLRGRERGLLEKIDAAIVRLEEGIFGECQECGDPIGDARLRARPVTTLCIRCKEEQEEKERAFS
jgi:DnaK suppressor protein